MAQKAKIVRTKIRKKSWYSLLAPAMFNNALLGEVYTFEPELMNGRSITANLMTLTNDMKQQSINLHFRVNRVKDGRGITEIIGYEMSPSAIRRLVRRDQDKLDMSLQAETSDGKLVRIKPTVLTRHSTTGQRQSTLRNLIAEKLLDTVRKSTFENLIGAVISYKLQQELRERVEKIYPLKALEIRLVELDEGTEGAGSQVKKAEPAKEAPAAEAELKEEKESVKAELEESLEPQEEATEPDNQKAQKPARQSRARKQEKPAEEQ